jgi:hypothetical protein
VTEVRFVELFKVLVVGWFAVVAIACDSTCENGQEKLDECEDEIAREWMKRPHCALDCNWPLPIGISDECTELDECVAECVNSADCPAIAHAVVHGPAQTDPNDVPPPGTGEFNTCINGCTLESE